MKNKVPCVVTIAGTDPSGGAGIQADIKAISATGSYAASVVTALVAQNTTGIQAIYEVTTDCVMQQLTSVFNDLDVQAVKIGMLHDARMINAITEFLETVNTQHIVFDPVMVAKDGSLLLDLNSLELMKAKLFKTVSLITPNLTEAEHLLQSTITTPIAMEAASRQLGLQYNVSVLIKGGHLNASQSSDVLYIAAANTCYWFHAERIQTKNTHGTGCSLSSAIASYLAQGFDLYAAVDNAKHYITQAIIAGITLSIGRGNGPVDHFYFLRSRVDDC